MVKTGPNDARCVVWALGMFFFLDFLRFIILSSFYLGITLMKRVWMGNEKKKGPKRHQTHHLGPRCVFFLFFFLHFIDNNGPKQTQTCRLGPRCFVCSSPRQPVAPHLPHPSLAWTTPTKAHK